jgi:UDP-N-acetylglucosamine 2-epimerase (non-hydrolysing)
MEYSLIVFGTRPELIKLIPIILEIRKRKLENKFKILCTGQHKELIDDLLDLFEITPDIKLPISNCGQSISDTLSSIIKELQLYVGANKNCIKYIIAQGDTTSVLAASMVAFLNKIQFAHIEAGLRTFDQKNPFPEEYFRQIISLSADIHFTPTYNAKQNLLKENIPPTKIIHTGNTIVDLINIIQDTPIDKKEESIKEFIKTNNNVIITCHRRENQNRNFDMLITAIKDLAILNPELNFIWLSHLNPFVNSKTKKESLKNISNVSVIKSINLFGMIDLYKASKLIITDSGGIQEEAVSFNVPTIVIREKTERPEAIEVGNSVVVGNSSKKLKVAFEEFLNKKKTYKNNPFGDGKAAVRIIDFFENLD